MKYTPLPPRKSIRHKGSAALAIIVVMGIVSSLMGVSMAKVTSVSTHSFSSNKITLQAHQLASDKAELLKSETYASLASQGKKAVTGSLYYDEVTVGKETTMPSNQNIKEKPCCVNVYYGDESIPRATLSFNRYSVSQNESSIPKGTILPWYGLMVLSMLLLAGVENLQAVIQAMVSLSDSRLPIPTLSMVKAPRYSHPLSP